VLLCPFNWGEGSLYAALGKGRSGYDGTFINQISFRRGRVHRSLFRIVQSMISKYLLGFRGRGKLLGVGIIFGNLPSKTIDMGLTWALHRN
jgi:hypothetical protein